MLRILPRSKPKTIYLSYVKQDCFYAECVKQKLNQAGYTVVSTPLQYEGKRQALDSEEMLTHADAVVSIISPTSTRSQRIWQNVAHARLNGLPVLPLAVHHFFDGVPFPNAIDAADDIHAGCQNLLAQLEAAYDYSDNTIEPQRRLATQYMRYATAVAVLTMMSISSAFLAVFA